MSDADLSEAEMAADDADPNEEGRELTLVIDEQQDNSTTIEAETQAEPVAPTDTILAGLLGRIGEVGTSDTMKIMIYGPPGGGKSTLAGQASDNLIVSVEKGLSSINNHPELKGSNVKELEYVSFYQLEQLTAYIGNKHEAFQTVKVISVDSVSELHKRGLAEVVDREYQNSPMMHNKYVAETEEHTENNEHLRQLVSNLRDTHCHLILIAHHRTVQDKSGNIKIIPDFSEKLANTLMAMMDVVGYMETTEVNGEEHRSLRVRSEGNIAAKCRYNSLPSVIEDPTWNVLYQAFQEQVQRDNA